MSKSSPSVPSEPAVDGARLPTTLSTPSPWKDGFPAVCYLSRRAVCDPNERLANAVAHQLLGPSLVTTPPAPLSASFRPAATPEEPPSADGSDSDFIDASLPLGVVFAADAYDGELEARLDRLNSGSPQPDLESDPQGGNAPLAAGALFHLAVALARRWKLPISNLACYGVDPAHTPVVPPRVLVEALAAMSAFVGVGVGAKPPGSTRLWGGEPDATTLGRVSRWLTAAVSEDHCWQRALKRHAAIHQLRASSAAGNKSDTTPAWQLWLQHHPVDLSM